MEAKNAFVDHTAQPTLVEVETALGLAFELWKQLVAWIEKQGVADREWKSSATKYGWSLRMKLKKRTIVYLGPCAGCFRVAFVLGDRAVEAARQSNLPIEIKDAIVAAPRYAEGTGLILFVRNASDLPPIRQLVHLKMAN